MDYDWRSRDGDAKAERVWFDDQDERFTRASAHFATDLIPFDRLIPYARLAKREVLELGIGLRLPLRVDGGSRRQGHGNRHH